MLIRQMKIEFMIFIQRNFQRRWRKSFQNPDSLFSGIHPDHHAWWINPNDPNFIIEGNDGGIGISRDRGANWVFDEKIPVGQFYHINVDNEMPYNVMGGMQDNGSWHGPGLYIDQWRNPKLLLGKCRWWRWI